MRRTINPFPLGAARLIAMHVCIDQSRHHDIIACIDKLRARHHIVPLSDAGNFSFLDMNRSRPRSIPCDNSLTSNAEAHYSVFSASIPGDTIVMTYTVSSFTW